MDETEAVPDSQAYVAVAWPRLLRSAWLPMAWDGHRAAMWTHSRAGLARIVDLADGTVPGGSSAAARSSLTGTTTTT
ncbi:hypothetical protein [Plantactinospora sp. DSM 117369]